MAPNCTVCNARGATECSTCKSAAYCSDKCQKGDERLHSMMCEQFAKFTTENLRPSKKAFLAIKLDPEEKVPQLVWIAGRNYNDMKILEMSSSNGLVKHDYLGPGDPRSEEVRITRHQHPSFALDHTVAFNYRDAFFYDGSKTNECVAAIANGEHKHRWCGQIIILSWPGFDVDPTIYQDVTAADLHHVTDYFKSFGDGLGVNEELKIGDQPVDFEKATSIERFMNDVLKDGKIKQTAWGVVVSCKGSQMFESKPKYAPVEVFCGHFMFQLKPTRATSLSKAIKLPILTYKHQTINPLSTQSGQSSFTNPLASALNLNLQVLSPTWGQVDRNSWSDRVGDITVVREDRKDITVQQVEALAQFALLVRDRVAKEMALELADEKMDMKVKILLRCKLLQDQVCRERFEEFFRKYKLERIRKGDKSWRGAVSPYSV